MKVLELFKGTGSVGKWFEKNHPDAEVISLDILKKYNPTICSDIMKWDYKIYQPGYFDLIWASPECKMFSSLQNTWIGRKWKDLDELNQKRKEHWKFAQKAVEIIEYFQPKRWFIENPWTSRMKLIPELANLPSYRFDYCQFGTPYKKPTRIWTNQKFEDIICGKKHKFIMGVASNKLTEKLKTEKDPKSSDTVGRYIVPEKLLDHLLCDGKHKIKYGSGKIIEIDGIKGRSDGGKKDTDLYEVPEPLLDHLLCDGKHKPIGVYKEKEGWKDDPTDCDRGMRNHIPEKLLDHLLYE